MDNEQIMLISYERNLEVFFYLLVKKCNPKSDWKKQKKLERFLDYLSTIKERLSASFDKKVIYNFS